MQHTKAPSFHSSHSRRKRARPYGVLRYRKMSNSCNFLSECSRMFSEMLASRGGLLLIWFTWPIAVITMIVAHLKRIWHLGTMYPNAAHLVHTSSNTDRGSSAHGNDVGVLDMDPRLSLSALELGRKIRDPDDPLTSRVLVELCIVQMKRVDPFLRAVVATRFEQARTEATQADKVIAARHSTSSSGIDEPTLPSLQQWSEQEEVQERGSEGRGTDQQLEPLPPFFGVPLVIKEVFEFEGFPYTAGLVGRRGKMGRITGPVVKQVQTQTGAIVLASTNISEACMWHESTNHVYGSTNNPYDFSRTAGGSSGGCGAAVASCMVPVSIASDVGGSIRIPALYNGLFGHKPTGGLVSNDHTFPEVGSGDIQKYCQLGPLSRCSEDLWPLLTAMKTSPAVDMASQPTVDRQSPGVSPNIRLSESEHSESRTEQWLFGGRDSVDSYCSVFSEDGTRQVEEGIVHFPEGKLLEKSSPELLDVDFSKLVVYYTKRCLGSSLFISALHPDVSVGMDEALSFLEQQGATVVHFDEEESVKEMFMGLNAFRVWSSLMSKHRHQPFSVTIREGLAAEVPVVGESESGQQQRMSFLRGCGELVKSLFDLSANTFPAMLLAVVEFISDLPWMEAENKSQCAEGLRLKGELNFLLSPEYKFVEVSTSTARETKDDSGIAVASAGGHAQDKKGRNIDREYISLCESASLGDIPSSSPSCSKSKVLHREHVLLLPSLPTPAPFHAESILRVFDTSNTAFFNVMELPVTAVPLGLTKSRCSNSSNRDGAACDARDRPRRGRQHWDSRDNRRHFGGAKNLPVGMQIVGGPNRDHVTIGIAMALEKAAVAGWKPPVAK